jgi:SNF2 family DNA or RNA helicase
VVFGFHAQEVQSMQFNILVTTYETIMRDRSKLSKLSWKYIIIDEAQRMKDRWDCTDANCCASAAIAAQLSCS